MRSDAHALAPRRPEPTTGADTSSSGQRERGTKAKASSPPSPARRCARCPPRRSSPHCRCRVHAAARRSGSRCSPHCASSAARIAGWRRRRRPRPAPASAMSGYSARKRARLRADAVGERIGHRRLERGADVGDILVGQRRDGRRRLPHRRLQPGEGKIGLRRALQRPREGEARGIAVLAPPSRHSARPDRAGRASSRSCRRPRRAHRRWSSPSAGSRRRRAPARSAYGRRRPAAADRGRRARRSAAPSAHGLRDG